MDGILNYVDNLMVNHPLASEELLYGGKITKKTGLGGFPPIYVCDGPKQNKNPFVDPIKYKREYSKPKESVSLKYIMEKRREHKPFINLK